ncbi:hypothetical protein ASG40_18200 [Methylobacterium sp. Leaf399]|uniref:hypothetical protein n=1 Tax=Methylobacterium sp. Leaf399 TaxID=1736364 RepID=UPI0006FF43D5|nr:hypothetical protein [Methylobacterium sp. Leaf399]KQT16172.1 hypothetical protein ASG40_18200 [Methylobacterium sp. Leaf399]
MAKAKPIPTSTNSETELTGLITTRTNLQARQSALAVEVDQAVATRRRLLIEDGDAAAIAEAERACREIEGTAYGITDALTEIERRISETEARIEVARVDAERERVAGGLEQNASEIEAAAANLAKSLAAVAKAHSMLAITISGAAAGQFDPAYGTASPVNVANALVLQGLIHAMPGLEIHAEVNPWSIYGMRQPVEGTDPAATASAFGQRLREVADQIRKQEIGQELPIHYDALPDFTPAGDEVQVFVISPFQYIGADRVPTMVTSPSTNLPRPVAERAIELSVASDHQSREWQAAHQDAGSHAAVRGRFGWEDCVDIEFDLAAWRRAETERQRSAWLTDQRQAA